MSSLPRAMDAMERFNRRTISFSSKQDVMSEVAEILRQASTLEEDEESTASDDVLRDLGPQTYLGAPPKTPSSRPSLLPGVKEQGWELQFTYTVAKSPPIEVMNFEL